MNMIIAFALLTFAVQIDGEKLMLRDIQGPKDLQDSINLDKLANKFVDKLVGKFTSQVLMYLDNATFVNTRPHIKHGTPFSKPLFGVRIHPPSPFPAFHSRFPVRSSLPVNRVSETQTDEVAVDERRPLPELLTTRRTLGAAALATAGIKWPFKDDKGLTIVENPSSVASMAHKVLHQAGPCNWCDGSMCEIMCEVIHGGLFADSKYFVDMPMLTDPSDVLASFRALQRHTDGSVPPKQLENWVSEKFASPGSDLEQIDPVDWKSSPAVLTEVADTTLRSWASHVHGLWRSLVRQPVRDVRDNPQRHTLLWTDHPIVVPGGRFRESYYWDTYWIVQGLVVSEMFVTARGVVENLLALVERYGFVPNGGRSYYLHRSQPPMLSEMVRVLVDDLNKRGEKDEARRLTQRSLPVLEKEYRFWAENRTAKVKGNFFLSHYDSESSLPRPESFKEDVALLDSTGPSKDPRSVFRAVGAAAESGWDFSSRWLADGQSLSSIDTTRVFPVDLNAILLRMELNLRNMHLALGNANGAKTFGSFATSRFTAMNRFMWSDSDGCWTDITRELTPRQQSGVTASSFIPLWALARMEDAVFLGANSTQVAVAVDALSRSGLIRPGGVVSTSLPTGQQWDSPNAWAPLQQMLVEGLVGGVAAQHGGAVLGEKIAKAWIETNFAAWKNHRLMFEKYDADVVGHGGGGGEYIPQTGFGWTNGVALVLLSQFYSRHPAIGGAAV